MKGSRGAFNRIFLSGRIVDVRTSGTGARLRLAARVFDLGDARANRGSAPADTHDEVITVDVWRTSAPLRVGNIVLASGSLRTNPLAIVDAEVALLDDGGPVHKMERHTERGSVKEHGVVEHQRTLASGRVIWVTAHRRGKKKPQ